MISAFGVEHGVSKGLGGAVGALRKMPMGQKAAVAGVVGLAGLGGYTANKTIIKPARQVARQRRA